jgi:nucleoside-diphosphate-sugar epimerase
MTPIADDIAEIVAECAYWQALKGRRLFLTGATGFFGLWLLESFVKANDDLGLNAHVTALSRNPQAFAQIAPHLFKHPSIDWLQGDVREFAFPDSAYDFVIHGAMTTAAETFHKTQTPLHKYDLVVNGTRRVLDFSASRGVGKLLLLSSGPTYGRQPADMTHIPEDYPGAPLTTDTQFDFSVLGEAKRVAELMSTVYAEQYGLQVCVARCFSFVGPYLPLDLHYAVGNFIADVLAERAVRIRGDGRALRSYQYIADTMVWLWTLLLAETQGIFNVGSDQAYSIAELAEQVVNAADSRVPVIIEQPGNPGQPVARYIPAIAKARQVLGLDNRVDLTLALNKTLAFHRRT